MQERRRGPWHCRSPNRQRQRRPSGRWRCRPNSAFRWRWRCWILAGVPWPSLAGQPWAASHRRPTGAGWSRTWAASVRHPSTTTIRTTIDPAAAILPVAILDVDCCRLCKSMYSLIVNSSNRTKNDDEIDKDRLLDSLLNGGQLLLLTFGQLHLLLLNGGEKGGFLIGRKKWKLAAQTQRRLRIRFAQVVRRVQGVAGAAARRPRRSPHRRRDWRSSDQEGVCCRTWAHSW